MKLVTLLILFGFIHASASSYAQSAKISLDLNNAGLKDVITEIQKQTEFVFFYSPEDIEEVKSLNVNVKEAKLPEILDECFEGTALTYEIKHKAIVLKKLPKELVPIFGNEGEGEEEPQKKTISGKISDSVGLPLPGASIIVKGTTIGIISDSEGNYELEVPFDAKTLMVSFVGMEAQEIEIAGQSTINVSLKESLVGIEEVVAVGYGTMKRSDLTGALSSVTSADFEQQPLFRADQALQGRSAGIQVTQTSGTPGGAFKVRIRGANSISGDNNPLYVVDGFAVGDISNLNANDIESMEVLKDASATAIYGSRGANGVILVTTKSGKRGRTEVIFDTYLGISNAVSELPMLTPAEWAEGVNFWSTTGDLYSEEQIAGFAANPLESWHDRLFNTAFTNNYQLSISGGKDKMDYYVSGNYMTDEGTLINQDYVRYTIKSNLNVDLSPKVKAGINFTGTKEKNSGVRADLFQALTWDPTTPLYNENGEYNYTPFTPGVGNGFLNPLIAPNENIRDVYKDRVNVNGYFDFALTKKLTLNIYGGVMLANQENNAYTSVLLSSGVADIYEMSGYTYMNTNRLTYQFDKESDHELKVDIVHEQFFNDWKSKNLHGEGFFSDNTTYKKMSLAQIQRLDNSYSTTSLQSLLGRVNYGFKDRYLFTASIRADGSSKFRKGNRWGYFPSGSVAWRMSEENFLKSVELINNLKVRVSYGVTGSQAVNPLSTYAKPLASPDVNYPFFGDVATIGIAPSDRLANTNLTWESTEQGNIGLDLGLWESRLTFSIDLYKKHTYDLLLDRRLPQFLGPTKVTENVGEVENRGFDITLGFVPLQTNDWNITSTMTVSHNANEVLALVNDEPIELGNNGLSGGVAMNPTRVEVGQPISSFRGYIFEGVYQLGEEAEATKFGRKPGDAKLKDFTEDGVISTDDVVTVGNGNPDFTFGWNTSVSWKNLEANFLFVGSYGNDIYNIQKARMMGLGSSTYSASHGDFADRWSETNPSNVPAYRDGMEIISSQFVEDGSFVSLKNVSISYKFGRNGAFDKIGLDNLKLYGGVENAFILTKYTGYDPETTAQGNSDIDVGIDVNAYPLSRKFTFGIRFIF